MQKNRTRADLRSDILYSLGYPIVKVNLTDQHLDNCINAALKKWWRWHTDGTVERFYVVTVGDQDVTNGYILLPEYIDTVTEVMPPNDYWNNFSWATPQWQMVSSTVMSMNRFLPVSLVDYVGAQARINNTRAITGDGVRPFTWARISRRVIPHFPIKTGDILAFRVFEDVDPERTDAQYVNSSLAFDNETLKDLATAYAKQQWGMILRRFSGMTLPGNVQIDGQTLIDEGNSDEAAVMERLKNETVDGFWMA